ncbi:LysM domain-containing protein [Dyadobacter jejuensis]|uniref:LysM domain-containing protein n=1 Tax=Dyadobacter jejuensis TaxID=1082580 RepID=A0A316AKU5_9BACT|nr:LysM peptidoglycan-binding domain-containing protein [Dyadobacter jejuensis]PWJ58415.1 LysM domain-containing protein [Dyadobacter jejuensis]
MEDQFPKKRNVRPTEKSNLPIITLSVLVLLVLAILYIGYEYITDDASSSEELTTVVMEPESEQEAFADDQPIDEPARVQTKEISKEPEPAKVEPAKEERPKVSASSIGGKTISHKVKSGETWTSIAAQYNLKLATLQGLNADISSLKANTTTLSVQVKDLHTVGPGDVLRVVASKYGVSKSALMKANGKSKDYAQRGEKLVIPFPSKK